MASLPGPGAINNVRNYPTIVISVAGGQGGNTAMYLLDGAIHEDPYNNLTLPLPFPDALQEFKVETSALPAQYGYHSGSVVNAVTKSGTNDFHGDLFEFIRNGDFNARDFFAPKRDTLKRNQFGGVAGGHIIRDKLFFFGGYQRTTQRSDPEFAHRVCSDQQTCWRAISRPSLRRPARAASRSPWRRPRDSSETRSPLPCSIRSR